VNNETTIITFTLRTVGVTEDQWISSTATTMEDDTIESVERARVRNLKALHTSLATPPPALTPLGLSSAWREPYDDLRVTIHEKIIRQDLISGEALEERELGTHTTRYYLMNLEEN